jgi:hypothetical protein
MSNNSDNGGFFTGMAIVALWLIFFALDPIATRHVLQLACNGTLSNSKKYSCSGTSSAFNELKIQINTHTQKVRILGYDLKSNKIDDTLRNCGVVDGDNWDCKSIISETISSIYAMRDGYFYYTLDTKYGGTLNYSGLTGIPYWLYRWNIFDLNTALSWE